MPDVTTTVPTRFPDSAVALMDFLELEFPELAGKTGLEVPDEFLEDTLPWGLIFRWGGERSLLSDRPVIDVSIFAATYAEAEDLAGRIDARLVGYSFRVSSGGRSVLVDGVEVVAPITEVPWQAESTIRRFQGTYQLSIRR